jgi:uracil-DNA glycosylase
MTRRARDLEVLLRRIRRCRLCVEAPLGAPLPHEPRPVLRASATAKLCICSQAPGVRVNASGRPFTDASGDRLRAWLAVTAVEFYDRARVAIVPMGFCFPGHDAAGGDLPPRPECARRWHGELFAHLPQFELVLLVGSYAQRWHLRLPPRETAAHTVKRWREIYASAARPRRLPLPHPSWRNNAWLAANPWFEAELLAFLRPEVRRLL